MLEMDFDEELAILVQKYLYTSIVWATDNRTIFKNMTITDASYKLSQSCNNKLKSIGLVGCVAYSSLDNDLSVGDENNMLKRAIECDCTNSCAYFYLAMITRNTTFVINSKKYTRLELFLEAIKYGYDCNSNAYLHLALEIISDQCVTLFNGRICNREQLLIDAIYCNPTCSYAYYLLSKIIDNDIILRDGQVFDKYHLGLVSYKLRQSPYVYLYLKKLKPYWNHEAHAVGLYERDTNILFATLLLAIQKLEDDGKLCLAHQAMFEEMLGYWEDEY